MSIQLAPVDLSTAIVGTSGSIPLGQSMPPPTIHQQMQPTATLGATLVLFNESGAGLKCLFPSSGESFTVPGGGWRQVAVPPGETALNYTVQYILPGANVSLFLADLYLPGEVPDSIGVLGNSPIGVGGSVTTSTTSALKQDGLGPGTSLIESTPSDQGTSSESWNNDASGFEQVLSAGVMRDVRRTVRGNAAATKAVVKFGDAGDLTITTLFGLLSLINSDAGAIQSDGAGNWITALKTALAGAVGGVTHADFKQTVAAGATAGEYALVILHDGTFDLFDVTHNGTIMNGNLTAWTIDAPLTAAQGATITGDESVSGNATVSGTTGLILRNSNGSGVHGFHQFTGTGTGTFTHGLTTTPNSVQLTTHQLNSTQTMGYDTEGGTTVHVNTGASLTWVGLASVHT